VRVLVSGATGFLGRHLVARLTERHEVLAIARRPAPAGLGKVAEWVLMDLSRPIDPARLPERVDAVVHLAQSERYREFPDGAEDLFAVNVASTFGLLDYARRAGASRFVHASSGSVYGASHEPLTEGSPLAPAGFYAASKAAAERLVESYAGLLHTVVLRPFFVYGPGQTGMLIPTLTERVLGRGVVEVVRDPGMRLTPIYIEDAARACESALDLEGHQVCNLAGSEAVSVTQLVQLIGEAAGVTPQIRHLEGAPAGDFVADNARMKELLGGAPRVSLREGIGHVVAAARAEHDVPAG
jgi:UDP-glucose 4-epimerase